MKVSKYISQLLHHHECVILPDFGGFVSNYQSARIDNVNNTFYPPRKDVLFNKQLTKNDGLLINYMAQLEGIEYLESKKIVVGFVKASFEKLKSGHRLVFEDIGTFYYNEHRLLQFEPDLNANFLLDSYGLSSIHLPALQESTKIEKRQETSYVDIKPAPLNRKRVMRHVAMAASVILLIGFFPVRNQLINAPLIKNEISLNPLSLFKAEPASSPKASAHVYSKIQTISHHKLDRSFEAFKIKDKENTAEASLPQLEDRCYIIVGSCSNAIEAQNFADEIARKGYKPILLEPDKGRFRIAIKGFMTKKEALGELGYYRKNEFPTAWVWIKR